jgi:hypothetical protein
VTADIALAKEAPPELKPALPDLPPLAAELTNVLKSADAVYSGALTDEELASE